MLMFYHIIIFFLLKFQYKFSSMAILYMDKDGGVEVQFRQMFSPKRHIFKTRVCVTVTNGKQSKIRLSQIGRHTLPIRSQRLFASTNRTLLPDCAVEINCYIAKSRYFHARVPTVCVTLSHGTHAFPPIWMFFHALMLVYIRQL